tara:strand:+ start:448 stop:615 length:168 start_codon:yes stop_codon:yes gene_type:complete
MEEQIDLKLRSVVLSQILLEKLLDKFYKPDMGILKSSRKREALKVKLKSDTQTQR